MLKDENYERQFELKEQEIETRNSVQFQDLLNSCVAHNLTKRRELIETQNPESPESPLILEDIDQISVMTEQMQTMQKNLYSKFNLIMKTKLMFEKRTNQYREALQNIRVQQFEVNDDQVIKELHQANRQMYEFQQLAEKFRKNQLKQHEIHRKDLESEQEELRKQQQRIQELKHQNQQLKLRIRQLDLDEQEKKRKLHECFQTSEYIEFFTEVQSLQEDKEVEQANQINREQTRTEIVSMMDEFYNNQDLQKLTQEIIQFFRSMNESLKVQTQTYNSLIEEKTLRKNQLDEVIDEYNKLRSDSLNQSPNQSMTLEFPQVIAENQQLSHYIKQNQLCLLTIHMKSIDLISRICIGVIWLSETSKSVPKSLDNLCVQYLKGYSKTDMKLFIPKQSLQSKKLGSFVSIFNRNKKESSPKGSSTNITTATDRSFDADSALLNIQRFKQLRDGYEQIKSTWLSIIKNDHLTYKFVKEINLDSIELNQPIEDIVLQLYTVYADMIQKINYFQHYEQQFSYLRDIIKMMSQSKNKVQSLLSITPRVSSTHLSGSYTPNKYIEVTYKGLLKRLANTAVEEEEPVILPDNVKKIQKTSDETKFHQYFIQQSSIIQRKSPLLHEKLISQTLQTIDQMRKKELDDNYMTSDQATSDLDYLNQERRNLKGMLNKKIQQQQESKSEERDLISSRSILKQVSLLSKISHLSRVNSKSPYTHVNKSIQKLNNTVQKKMSEYFSQEMNPTENRIRYPPIEKKSSTRSPDLKRKSILESYNLQTIISSSKGRSFLAQ